MTTQISPSEWEALSAYLDNQLSDRDRAQVDARLKNEPQLGQALEDLRRTRVILRNQPRLRAPRNFTLTPATAGARTRRSSSLAGLFTGAVGTPFSTLRLASVLATVFLVLITVGDLTIRRLAPEPRIVSMAEQSEVPIMGMGGGGGGGGGVVAGPEAAATEQPAAIEALPVAPALASEIPDQRPLVATPLSSPAAEMRETAKQPPTMAEGPPVVPADTQNSAAPSRAPASTLIRVLQALLVLLAVGAGIGALLLRRNMS